MFGNRLAFHLRRLVALASAGLAALCLLAGADFLRGGDALVSPRAADLATARREGWIWFKRPAETLRSFAE